MMWVIVCETPCPIEGDALYWSNEWGWGSLDGAIQFTDDEKETNRLPVGGKWVQTGVFRYDCFGETLSFAEGLGWANWLDDVDDDTDPQTIDEAEVDALNFIREKGFTIEME